MTATTRGARGPGNVHRVRRVRRRRLLTNLYRYCVLVIYAAVCLFPLYWMLSTSLKPDRDQFSYTVQFVFSPTLEHYAKIFTRDNFKGYLLNSALISAASVLIALPFGVLAGYALARFRFKLKEDFFFFALSTRMGPPVATAVPLFLLMLRFNLLDTRAGLILAYVFMSLGFCIWMARSFFEDLPKEAEEAAMLDGCSHLGVLTRVAIPLASGGLIATALLVFIFAWNEYFFASVLTREVAKPFTVHLPSYFGNRRILWGPLSAASFLGALVPIGLAIAARRYLVQGLTFGTIKHSRQ